MDEFLAMAYAKSEACLSLLRDFSTRWVHAKRASSAWCCHASWQLKLLPLRVFGDGNQKRCLLRPGHSEALVRMQGCPIARGEVFNVGSTEEISIKGLAELVVEILGSKSQIEFLPYSEACARFRRTAAAAGNLKLAEKVHFKPATPLRKIIELTAASI
jgi:UDP-glucose 4-epimerase